MTPPLDLYNVGFVGNVGTVKEEQEWFSDDTIRVRVTGIFGNVTSVGTGSFNSNTIIVDKTGTIGNTTEVSS